MVSPSSHLCYISCCTSGSSLDNVMCIKMAISPWNLGVAEAKMHESGNITLAVLASVR